MSLSGRRALGSEAFQGVAEQYYAQEEAGEGEYDYGDYGNGNGPNLEETRRLSKSPRGSTRIEFMSMNARKKR